jgi:hypothetical protein
VDLDELVGRLIERGLVGAVRRDIGTELHANKIPTPSGRWTLLVTLPGQAWTYVAGGSRSADVPYDDLARKVGLRVIHAGYSDFSNSTAFVCFEGAEMLVRFESCSLEHEVVEEFTGGFDEMFSQTMFRGSRLPKEWLDNFDDPFAVQDALAKEFDAYIPFISDHHEQQDPRGDPLRYADQADSPPPGCAGDRPAPRDASRRRARQWDRANRCGRVHTAR